MKLLLLIMFNFIFIGCSADKYTLFQEKNSMVTSKDLFIQSNLNDNKVNTSIKTKKVIYEYKIAPNDRLSIMVYNHPELSTTSSVNAQTNKGMGFLVSNDGTISVALIGDIKVQGLTAKEASGLIQNELAKYVKNPYVNIEIINKRIYVLGEVEKPGMIAVDSDYMSIIEVISSSGGFTTYAARDNIKILRGDLNNPDITTIDLTNINAVKVADLMIRPNDVIYIQPNSARATNIAINEVTPAIALFNSILSTFVNIKYLTDK